MVRHTELTAARRGARKKLAGRQAHSSFITATFVDVDPEDSLRALIRLDEQQEPITVTGTPVKLVPGSLVSVAVDHAGRPIRVIGPISARPEGLSEDAEAPAPVTPMPGLAWDEMTDADREKLDRAALEASEAKDDIAEALGQIEDLDEKTDELETSLEGARTSIDALRDELEGWDDTVETVNPDYQIEWECAGNGKFTFRAEAATETWSPHWDITPPGGVETRYWSSNSLQLTVTEPGTMLVAVTGLGGRPSPTFTIDVTPEMVDGSIMRNIAAGVGRFLQIEVDQIVAGTGQFRELVAQRMWAVIATFEKIITEELIATGAVTAPALNVVYTDPDTGYGFRLEPEGLTIMDADGQPVIALRADMTTYFTIMKDGAAVASISPDGHIAGSSMSVQGDFRVRGETLDERDLKKSLGIIASSNLVNNTYADLGWAKIGHVTFRSLAPNRRIRAELELSTNNETTPRVQVAAMRADGTQVTSNNTIQRIWEHGDGRERKTARYVFDFNTPGTGVQSVGFFIRGRDSGGVFAMASTSSGASTRVVVRDDGPAITEETFAGVASGGSQTGTQPTGQDDSFSPAATRSYRGNNTHYTWNENFLFHGYNQPANGSLRSLAVFNRTAVNALTSGADMESGYIELVNAHTWANSGMTVRVGYTNHTSVPSTWSGTGFTLIGTYEIERGATLKIPLTTAHLNAVKSGAFNAVALVPSSTSGSQYGYFRAASTELYIKVRK